jgi:N-acetylmuramoyl-L-alanine amidase
MRINILLMACAILLLPAGSGATDRGLTVKGIRYSTYATFTRIVFEVEAAAPYVLTRSQDGRSIQLGSYDGPLVLKIPVPMIRDGVVAGMDIREGAGRTYAVIRLQTAAGDVKDFTLRGPDRIVLDIARSGTAALPVQPVDRPVVAVLDPGHGGKDPGLLTGLGLEKTVDLELATMVKKKLNKSGKLKAVLTREKDQTLALDERAALSNTAGASVFVSIHAAPGTGMRVYVQDLVEDPSDAAVHAQPLSGDFLGYEAESEQRDLIWGRQQAAHAQQSRGLGRTILKQFEGRDGAEPIQAPLAGLRAVDAAAVMVEVGMDQDRARIADDLARGIEQYVRENR